jgi:hypothetical protein
VSIIDTAVALLASDTQKSLVGLMFSVLSRGERLAVRPHEELVQPGEQQAAAQDHPEEEDSAIDSIHFPAPSRLAGPPFLRRSVSGEMNV